MEAALGYLETASGEIGELLLPGGAGKTVLGDSQVSFKGST